MAEGGRGTRARRSQSLGRKPTTPRLQATSCSQVRRELCQST